MSSHRDPRHPDYHPGQHTRSGDVVDLRQRAANLRDTQQRNRPQPPQETGQRLATMPRPQKGEELRLTLDEYEGHRYLRFQIWTIQDNGAWPKKGAGVTIRLSELPDVADGIAAAIDIAQGMADQRRGNGR